MLRAIVVLTSLVAAACGDSITTVCEKDVDCWLKRCEYTDEACDELARGRLQECVVEIDSFLAAVATSDRGACDDCIDAFESLLDCKADLDSCAAFEDAERNDGQCAAEAAAADAACDDIDDVCFT